MPKVLLRNINPLGFVDLPIIGRQGSTEDPDGDQPGSGCLVPDEVFSVDADVAGEAPHWRPSEEGDADADGVIRRFETRVEDDLLEVWDLGHGLLAQVGNFELATDELDKLTIEQLVAHAAAQEPPIDIAGLKKKPDILAAIRKG